MPKFIYEKFIMHFSYFVAVISFFGVLAYAYWTETQVKLPDNNIAPFSEETLLKEGEEGLPFDQRFLSLDKPHRTNKELQSWLTTVVSESLTFDTESYPEISNKVQKFYTDYGFEQFQEYLRTAKILPSLQENNYRMNVFVEDKPALLNAVSSKGIYRWFYQIPVTISFLPKNAKYFSGQGDIANSKLILRLQIRRAQLPRDPNAIQIESWTVTHRR